jgi:hypothetical protein
MFPFETPLQEYGGSKYDEYSFKLAVPSQTECITGSALWHPHGPPWWLRGTATARRLRPPGWLKGEATARRLRPPGWLKGEATARRLRSPGWLKGEATATNKDKEARQ